MLKKSSELKIDPKNPFANDALKRKPAIELLTKLAESTTQPFVLSVEAPFGQGKTTFLNLWKAQLELEGHRWMGARSLSLVCAGFEPVQFFKQLVVAASGGIQNLSDFGQPARILKTLLVHENAD